MGQAEFEIMTLVEAFENKHFDFGPADPVEAIKFRRRPACSPLIWLVRGAIAFIASCACSTWAGGCFDTWKLTVRA